MSSSPAPRSGLSKAISLFFLPLVLLFAVSASAQVRIVYPLPFGILPVSGDPSTAAIHLLAQVDAQYTEFSMRVAAIHPDSTSDILIDWTPLQISNGTVDTVLRVPTSRDEYVLEWHARAILGTGGSVTGLRAGRIFGIAGQSNAVGFNWEMNVPRHGDIRMLRDSAAWVPAVEPTGESAGGPWIVMANRLWREFGDSLAIGLINTAVGSTSLTPVKTVTKWYRDPEHPLDSGIYGHAVRRFLACGGPLQALLWIQGEADGAALADPGIYTSAFKVLLDGFRSDLGQQDLRAYHLQISGNSNPGAPIAYLPVVREALRILPSSTLVGTAAGRSINPDGLHYTVPTYTAVGQLFADAIVTTLAGKPSPAYPPVTPDTAAFVDSTSTLSADRFIRLHWRRGANPTTSLAFVNDRQAFVIARDKRVYYDTSQVWSRIDPNDPTSVLVGLRRDSITSNHSWTLSYIRTAGAEHAPLATIVPGLDAGTRDTIFAVAFLDLPVYLPGTKPIQSVPELSDVNAYPNPSRGALSIKLTSGKQQSATIELSDIDGRRLSSTNIELTQGPNEVSLPVAGLPDQAYLLSLQVGSDVVVRKIVLIR
jgi:hypothetical protein